LRESRFRHDFSQVGIERVGLQPIQAKLTIGEPGDKYEQEADWVASQVVQQINAPTSVKSSQGQSVQRTEVPEEEEIQVKPENTSLQRKEAIARWEASMDLDTAINSAKGGGQSLDAGLQGSMGQAMGADFSGVKVHTDAQSNQLNQSIQAKAFTTGQDVFFRQGAYEPGSRGGQELIAHELTPVMQHNGGAAQWQWSSDDEKLLQGKFPTHGMPTQFQTTSSAGENRTGMPDSLKEGLEQLSGMDMSDVRVHYNSTKPAQLGALAYTQGRDIEVGLGQERHLPHEGWHVVQQMQGRVKPTVQAKGVSINDDVAMEREADVMGAKALQMKRSDRVATGSTSAPSQQTETAASPSSAFLKTSSMGGTDNAPIQGRFGFEIELPILFLHKRSFMVPAGGHIDPHPINMVNRDNVPCDAADLAGETEVYDAHGDGADCHVNVDHFGVLDGLYNRELGIYANANGFDDEENRGLTSFKAELMPNRASIMEVVTDAWDENALTREQAQQKIHEVVEWVDDRFDLIQGNQQAALGPYFIGSTSPDADQFQPRLGYFHATYGVKLSQVPRLFQETTNQKNALRTYANRELGEAAHADNVRRTFKSIGKARSAQKAIKAVWPRQGAGRFTKGTKGWNPGTEEAFLGFLTLVDNYLLMFQSNSTSNLGKQKVGMHYYKSDLYDLANQLPAEIINTLTGNAGLRRQVVAAIGASVGLAANTELTGPMADWTLTEYLEQLFTGVRGSRGQDVNNANIYDPLLADSINPWSAKLGPEQIGHGGNTEMGVVMENRHLEYQAPNYVANTEASSNQYRIDLASPNEAVRDSAQANYAGSARRPINEWGNIMMSIYEMLVDINQ